MYVVSLKDHCLDCKQILYYEFSYTIASRMSTKIWCKYCNSITTYFEYDLRLVYKKMIDDLSNYVNDLPGGYSYRISQKIRGNKLCQK